MELVETTGCESVEAENYVMNTSHAELGAYCLGLWGFPDSVVDAVAFHHKPFKLVNGFSTKENHPSGKDAEETESNDGNSGFRTINESLTDFSVLTAVHVANALITQENCTLETEVFPYCDMDYLKVLNMTDKFPEWVECYNKIVQEEDLNE